MGNIHLIRSEKIVSWQGTEFYKHADIDIIHRNRSEILVRLQGIEFNTYVDIGIICVNRIETNSEQKGNWILYTRRCWYYSSK
jgi:hypothetical protein